MNLEDGGSLVLFKVELQARSAAADRAHATYETPLDGFGWWPATLDGFTPAELAEAWQGR